MTEMASKVPRCQRCGGKLDDHGDECVSNKRSSFDVSHNRLMEIDELAGKLLAEMLRFRSADSLASTTFAEEFFALIDLRRKP